MKAEKQLYLENHIMHKDETCTVTLVRTCPWHNRVSVWLSLRLQASDYRWCLIIDGLLYSGRILQVKSQLESISKKVLYSWYNLPCTDKVSA